MPASGSPHTTTVDGFHQVRGYPVRVESSPTSRDPDTAHRLWVVSEELTGVRFPI